MKTEALISIEQYCLHNELEPAFISELNDFGFIELIEIEKTRYIPFDYLTEIDKLKRLHYDLEINLEGIDVISHLLQRINQLKEEMYVLKERLNIYE